MRHNTVVLPVVAGMLASVLAGCGVDGGSGDAEPLVVGTLDRFELTEDSPAPFDPALAYEAGAWSVLRNTSQTLMALPRSGSDPVPDAATACSFTDQHHEQYRCTLRGKMTFANGNALTAEDVKFSIERVLTIRHPNGPVSLLSNIDRVEAPSATQVVFHLKTPDATFPYKLTTPAAAIVDSEVYQQGALRNGFHVDGSGPYTVKAEMRGRRLHALNFTRNPRYDGRLKLRNNEITMRFLSDSRAMEKALKEGDIDLMTRSTSPRQIARLERGMDKDIELTTLPGQEIRYLAFHTDHPAVRQRAVRQAMAQVIDREALVRDVYERTVKPLYSLVPSNLTGHVNSFYNRYGEPDPEAAGRTLRSAGVATPVELTLTYTTDHYGPATAKEFAALQKQLNDSGLFDVSVQGVPWEAFRPAQVDRKYAVYGLGWFPDFPDADNYVAPFFAKDNFLNTPYRNDAIRERLIPQTRQKAERSAAVEGFARVQNLVARDVPVLPLWEGKQYIAARDDVYGVEWALNSSSVLQLWELGRGPAG